MMISSRVRNIKKDYAAVKLSILLLMLMMVFTIACEKKHEGSDYNPPADHTINNDGFLHKSGLNDPLTNCVTCHGSDLKGGTTAVSCYECHGKEW